MIITTEEEAEEGEVNSKIKHQTEEKAEEEEVNTMKRDSQIEKQIETKRLRKRRRRKKLIN